jgi:putative toxin-antitoxin system antitoxin component (TIGR02293 family)
MADSSTILMEQLKRIGISEFELKAHLDGESFNQVTLEQNLKAVINKAESVLQSPDAVKAWLLSPIKGLAYKKPLLCVCNDEGAREVIDLLSRIEHGVFS